MFLFSSYSLLLGFYSISFGISLLESSTCASCKLLCQTEHMLPTCSLHAKGMCVSGGSVLSTVISAAEWRILPLASGRFELASRRLGCSANNGSSSCLERMQTRVPSSFLSFVLFVDGSSEAAYQYLHQWHSCLQNCTLLEDSTERKRGREHLVTTYSRLFSCQSLPERKTL